MNLSVKTISEIEKIAKPIREGIIRNSKKKSFWGGDQWMVIQSYLESRDVLHEGDKVLFQKICSLLERNGWDVTLDPEIDQNYPILNKTHRMASKGQLQILLKYNRSNIKLEIFPIYNSSNRSGPRYGFEKYDRMTYLDKKRTDLILKKIQNYLIKNGFSDHNEPIFNCPREMIEFKIRSSLHFKEFDTNSGSRPDVGEYNSRDKDKKILVNGQEKYFRNHKGKLQRGIIYHNINNMWWVLTAGQVDNIASFEFFDADSPSFLQREKSGENRRSLAREIRKAVESQNKQKESLLRDLLWKANGGKPEDERYVIQCVVHEDKKVLWWCENSNGYTENIDFAGRYSYQEAVRICSGDRGERMFKLSEYHLAVPGKKQKKGHSIDRRYKRVSA